MVAFVPLVFANYLNDNIETPKLALWILCLGVAAVVWVKQKQQAKVNYPLTILLVILVLWSVISTIFSLDVINSLFGLYGRFTSSVLFYAVWAITVLLLVSDLTRDKLTFLLKTLVLTGTAVAVFGIVQSYGIAYYAGLDEPVRPLVPSFLGNPNFSSMFIASILPFSLLFLIQQPGLRSRAYYATTSVFMIIGLALFGSRGSLAATLAGLAVMVVIGLALRLGRNFIIGTALGLVITGVVAGLFLQATRPAVVGKTLEFSETTVEARFAAWDDAVNIIHRYPVLGAGPGNFFIAFNEQANSVFSNSERFDDAHNLLLHLAVNGGIVLAVVFIAVVVMALWQGWQNLRATMDPIYLALLAATVAWLISASFNPVVVGCWLLLAVLIAGLLLNVQRITVTLPKPAKITLVVIGIIAILAPLSFVASDALAFQATAAYGNRNWAKAATMAKWSLYFNPTNPTVPAYWAAGRIKSEQDVHKTEHLISYLVKLHPRSPRVQHLAATLYYLLLRQTSDVRYIPRIESSLEEAIRLEPNQSFINSHIAYIYYKLGQQDKALHYTRQALIADDNQFYSWVLLAQISLQHGDKLAFRHAVEQAYRLQPQVVLLKKTMDQADKQDNLEGINFPVTFPEPDI